MTQRSSRINCDHRTRVPIVCNDKVMHCQMLIAGLVVLYSNHLPANIVSSCVILEFGRLCHPRVDVTKAWIPDEFARLISDPCPFSDHPQGFQFMSGLCFFGTIHTRKQLTPRSLAYWDRCRGRCGPRR